MAEEKKILYNKEDGIGIITFNRPERMNAITDDMQVDLLTIIADASQDGEVKAVIVTGNGRAFCGGTDVTALGRDEKAATAERQKRMQAVRFPETPLPDWHFTRIPKPTIAAVNGAAVGMGAEWAAQCDFRIASENARFGWVFPLRGLPPDTGAGPVLLPYLVGLSKALELMYSGEIIDAREAERIGLVDKVVPPEELIPAAKELAVKMSKGAPLALKAVKELTYCSMEWPLSIHRQETRARFGSLSLTEDCKEGIRSFVEKRPPVWKGK